MSNVTFKNNFNSTLTLTDGDIIKCIIKSHNNEFVTVYHSEGGEATFPIEDIASCKAHKLVKNVNRRKITRPEPETEITTKVNLTNRSGSKAQKAFDIYVEHMNKTRKEVISMFVELLEMSTAGASTYYANAKNKHSATA